MKNARRCHKLTLVQELAAFVESGEAKARYGEALGRKDAKSLVPAEPLLYVPMDTSRMFDVDREAAGIPKLTKDGKLVFRCCRITFVSMVLQSGANLKDAMELARHGSPNLTLTVYGRTRREDLARIVDEVGKMVAGKADT